MLVVNKTEAGVEASGGSRAEQLEKFIFSRQHHKQAALHCRCLNNNWVRASHRTERQLSTRLDTYLSIIYNDIYFGIMI